MSIEKDRKLRFEWVETGRNQDDVDLYHLIGMTHERTNDPDRFLTGTVHRPVSLWVMLV